MIKTKTVTVEVESFNDGHLYSFFYNNRGIQSIYSDNAFCRGYLIYLMRFMQDGGFTHYKLMERGSKEVIYRESFNSLFNRVYR